MDVPHWQICKGESFHSVAVSITETCYLSKLDITFGRKFKCRVVVASLSAIHLPVLHIWHTVKHEKFRVEKVTLI